MAFLIIAAYALVALVAMRLMYPILDADFYTKDSAELAVIVGLLWPLVVIFYAIALPFTALKWFASGGSR
jgi:hypothetical protein